MPMIEVLALLFASPVAITAPAEAKPAMAAAPKAKAKKICKNDPHRTGTRISARICKTEEEWNRQEDGQEIGVRSATSRADMENVGGMGQP